jgi:DNA-binding NarL/FixJ family response regulator
MDDTPPTQATTNGQVQPTSAPAAPDARPTREDAPQSEPCLADQRHHPPIRVVIVDDHPMVLEAIRKRLKRAGIKVLGAATEGAAVLRLLQKHQPDVLILDLRLPDMSGIEVSRRVRTSFPEIAVLVLTGYEDLASQRALLRIGVRGYLHKTVPGGEFLAAVQAVAQGRTIVWSSQAAAAVGSDVHRLTAREYQVL